MATRTRTRCAGPRGWRGPLPSRAGTATLDEYFAGRSDRLGTDIVLDVRAVGGSRLPAARPAPPGCDVAALVAVLRGARPNWLWVDGATLDGATGAELVHLSMLTRLGERVGAVVVLLVEDPDS